MGIPDNYTEQYSLSFSELELNEVRIRNLVGHSAGLSVNNYNENIKNLLKIAAQKCDIKCGYVTNKDVKIKVENNCIEVANITFFTKEIITSYLLNSGYIIFFVCTAGKEIEDYSNELLRKGDLLEGYILDIIGSEVAEAATDSLQNRIESLMQSNGLRITNRYSPGYCGWDVSEQHKVFKFFPESFCGVTLSESAFMSPVKSVSGIIGIGKNVRKESYSCNICDQRDCVYRNSL